MTPLGIPEGSVRAILAIAVVGAVIYCWVTGQEVSEFQKTITTAAVIYYFASRAAESKPEPPPPVVLDHVDLLKKVDAA